MARAVQGRGHDGHCVLALARARGQSFRWLMAARVEAVARARGGFGVGGRTTSSSTENGGKACSSRMNFLCEAAASWGSTRLALCFAQLAFSVNALSPPRRHPTPRRSHAYDHVYGDTGRRQRRSKHQRRPKHDADLCEDGLVLPKDSPFLGELHTVSVPETTPNAFKRDLRSKFQDPHPAAFDLAASSGRWGARRWYEPCEFRGRMIHSNGRFLKGVVAILSRLTRKKQARPPESPFCLVLDKFTITRVLQESTLYFPAYAFKYKSVSH